MTNNPLLSLTDAAHLVGKSKTTLWRAVKSGKVSAEKGENDQWLIHIAELDRVYKNSNVAQQFQMQRVKQNETVGGDGETVKDDPVLQEKIKFLEQDRDRLIKELSDLREEIHDERQDNRAERERLLGIVEQTQKQLTHERSRYDDEIKKARLRLKTAVQNKRQQTANANKILKEDVHKKTSKRTVLDWMIGRS